MTERRERGEEERSEEEGRRWEGKGGEGREEEVHNKHGWTRLKSGGQNSSGYTIWVAGFQVLETSSADSHVVQQQEAGQKWRADSNPGIPTCVVWAQVLQQSCAASQNASEGSCNGSWGARIWTHTLIWGVGFSSYSLTCCATSCRPLGLLLMKLLWTIMITPWCVYIYLQIFFFLERANNLLHPLAHSFSKWSQWPGLHKVEARRQKLNPGLLCGWQQSSHFSHHYCFPVSALAGSWSKDPELGIKPRHRDMRHKCLNLCFYC